MDDLRFFHFDDNVFTDLAKLALQLRTSSKPHECCQVFSAFYLHSVRLDKMHVQCRCVGENLATSLHGAEDVRPHFFGQLHYGGLYYFPMLRQRLFVTFQAVC